MIRLGSTITALALTASVGFGSILAPVAASADRGGNRDAAVILGAAAIALALTQNNHHNDRYRYEDRDYRYRNTGYRDDCDDDGYGRADYRRYDDRSYVSAEIEIGGRGGGYRRDRGDRGERVYDRGRDSEYRRDRSDSRSGDYRRGESSYSYRDNGGRRGGR